MRWVKTPTWLFVVNLVVAIICLAIFMHGQQTANEFYDDLSLIIGFAYLMFNTAMTGFLHWRQNKRRHHRTDVAKG